MTQTIKWIATFAVIVAFAITAYGIYPLGPIIQIVGSILWAIAAKITDDKPLLVTNVFIIVVGVGGIALNYIL